MDLRRCGGELWRGARDGWMDGACCRGNTSAWRRRTTALWRQWTGIVGGQRGFFLRLHSYVLPVRTWRLVSRWAVGRRRQNGLKSCVHPCHVMVCSPPGGRGPVTDGRKKASRGAGEATDRRMPSRDVSLEDVVQRVQELSGAWASWPPHEQGPVPRLIKCKHGHHEMPSVLYSVQHTRTARGTRRALVCTYNSRRHQYSSPMAASARPSLQPARVPARLLNLARPGERDESIAKAHQARRHHARTSRSSGSTAHTPQVARLCIPSPWVCTPTVSDGAKMRTCTATQAPEIAGGSSGPPSSRGACARPGVERQGRAGQGGVAVVIVQRQSGMALFWAARGRATLAPLRFWGRAWRRDNGGAGHGVLGDGGWGSRRNGIRTCDAHCGVPRRLIVPAGCRAVKLKLSTACISKAARLRRPAKRQPSRLPLPTDGTSWVCQRARLEQGSRHVVRTSNTLLYQNAEATSLQTRRERKSRLST